MPDNPAWRLHSLLEKLVNHTPETIHEKTEVAIKAAFRFRGPRTFGEDHGKDYVLYHVFHLQQLAKDVIDWVEKRELDRELFKRPVERLWRAVLEIRPDALFTETKERFSLADVTSLRYLSHQFEQEGSRNKQLVDQDEMEDLLAEVDALYDAVQASGMPEDVETFILEQLAAIKHAIRVYPYKGYESLQLALYRSIGATLLFSGRLDQVAPQYPEEVSRWKSVMRHLSTVLTKASEVATIAEPLKPYVARLLGMEEPK
ncbi:MAG TPA: hypothetical protein VIW80_06485 [Pyrinomonadaceae bacterium]|jgi:hypothetical protein